MATYGRFWVATEAARDTRLKRVLRPDRVAAGLILLALFVFFHVDALKVHFSPDEPMNLYYGWQPPVWKIGAGPYHFLGQIQPAPRVRCSTW